MTSRLRPALLSLLVVLGATGMANAHPAPFSYLDVRLTPQGLEGALFLHDYDVATELNVNDPDSLLKPEILILHRADLLALVEERFSIDVDGRRASIEWGALEPIWERQSLRLQFRARLASPPAHLRVQAYLFPYDPMHQTFVNFYEADALVQQTILDRDRKTADSYTGTIQGRLAVLRTFVLSGVEHILIGPDHVLFLLGLLLLGGSLGRLALIVTSFTIGHSLTLSIAALGVYTPPARLVEPLIALTIVIVGVDNLFVLQKRKKAESGSRDLRPWFAAVFGLIHGFGFAYVLREFGLPQAALVWSLFAFNAGVEIGQLLIVAVAASLLALIARRSEKAARAVAAAGSIAVILAGTYWFVDRTFLGGVS